MVNRPRKKHDCPPRERRNVQHHALPIAAALEALCSRPVKTDRFEQVRHRCRQRGCSVFVLTIGEVVVAVATAGLCAARRAERHARDGVCCSICVRRWERAD